MTDVEALTSGLPAFASQYGGPGKIIVHGESSFHINPYHGEQVTELLVKFSQSARKILHTGRLFQLEA